MCPLYDANCPVCGKALTNKTAVNKDRVKSSYDSEKCAEKDRANKERIYGKGKK